MKYLFIFLLSFYSITAASQNFRLVQSVDIETPTEVSIDRAGNIYYSTFNGDIIRYDPLLKTKMIFSPDNPAITTILEAWQGLRIFTFHRDLQSYRLINRNLSLHEDYSFPQDKIGFVEMATPSFDNNLWLIDQTDLSLIKYHITLSSISSRIPLNQLLDPNNYEIFFCKEYQNRLFISTKNYGILILDNFGNYLKKYQFPEISSFNFWRDIMYFIDENKLIKLHLYRDEVTSSQLPKVHVWLFALVFENRTYLFSENQLFLYE